jgi:hypothetical protein
MCVPKIASTALTSRVARPALLYRFKIRRTVLELGFHGISYAAR